MNATYEATYPELAPREVPSGHRGQILCVVAIMVAVPGLLFATNHAGLLREVFPPLGMAVAAFLLWRSKPAYVGFVIWMWFLTPFVGRISDYQGGWTPANPVELAPYVVTSLAGLPLLADLMWLIDRKAVPYVCALAAIAYGAALGLATLPLFNVLRALLNWLVPVIFGLFIYKNRQLYPQLKRVIERSFLFGVLIMGAYAIYQFFILADWDRVWIQNVQMNSFGEANPMQTRAFSTMNAPAIFGATMACGLLLLFTLKTRVRVLAAACGLTALVMTLNRAAWLSLAVGCVYLVLRLNLRARLRFALAVALCGVLAFAAIRAPGLREIVEQRIATFTQPSQDDSFVSRIDGHEQAFRQLAQEPWGEGIGSTDTLHNTEGDEDTIGPHDSTLLELLYSLGWVGAFLYLLGLGHMAVQIMEGVRGDPFVLSCQAILVALLTQCLLNSVMLGVMGFMVWTFASMSIAAKGYAEATEMAAETELHQVASFTTT